MTFGNYATRQVDLAALVASIQQDLTEYDLQPSRQLLVVVPGLDREPYALQREVFQALRAAKISVYLPGNKDVNLPRQKWPSMGPNGFWRDGAVMVSPVMQPKGNEADVVHVVRLDQVASREDHIPMRNQLFVGVSRSRGWVRLSGAGMTGLLAGEVRRVLGAGDTLRFTYHPPRRMLDAAE